jgi:phosphatidate cytidylyltransferase
VDERDEHEPETSEVAEPVTERVRITGAEPVGEPPATDEPPATGEPAWGSALVDDEASVTRRYLGFDSDESTEPTVAVDSTVVGDVAAEREPTAPDLPHWTEPPTGQVPAVLDRRGDEDDTTWAAGDAGPAWREHQHEWDDTSFEPALLADEETRVGALDDEAPPEHLQWEFGEIDDSGAGVPSPATAEPVARARHEEERPGPAVASTGGADDFEQEPEPSVPSRPVVVPDADDHREPQPQPQEAPAPGMVRVGASPAAPVTVTSTDVSTGRGDAQLAPRSRRRPDGATRAPARPVAGGRGGASGGGGRNVPLAVATGIGVAVVALVCFSAGTVATVAFGTVVVVLAAAECFAALRRGGYRPATLLGLFASGGLMVAAYAKGVAAFPLVIALVVAATMVWYLVGAERGSPVRGIAATLLGFAWVGVFGSFAGLILAPSQYPHRHGIAFLLGAVVAVVGADVGALAVGSWIGRHPLAPRISPNKTWEGFFGGLVVAVVLSVVITGHVSPWTPSKAAVLGVVAALLGPVGDLCESLIKRDLGLKDMGNLLPGHGGVLDRVDALLFVLPATYYLVRVLHLG